MRAKRRPWYDLGGGVRHMARRGTPTFTLRLDPEIRKSLEYLANEKGVTLSDVVRQALTIFIERKK